MRGREPGARRCASKNSGVTASARTRSGAPSPLRLARVLVPGHVRERAAACPVVLDQPGGALQLRQVDPGRVVADRHDAVRVGVRQLPEQHRMHDREDRDDGRDPERQRARGGAA